MVFFVDPLARLKATLLFFHLCLASDYLLFPKKVFTAPLPSRDTRDIKVCIPSSLGLSRDASDCDNCVGSHLEIPIESPDVPF